jgi:hypothetical protein
MDSLPKNPRVNIYKSLRAGQKTKLPLALKLWYKPLWANRSCSTPLHRTTTPSSQSAGCFSCHHAARTWPRWPPGPSSQAHLSLHSSEASQGIDLSRPLFTCTNANQAATCTCNIRPRVGPHHIANHSSQPEATIHRSLDAPVLNAPLVLVQLWSRD